MKTKPISRMTGITLNTLAVVVYLSTALAPTLLAQPQGGFPFDPAQMNQRLEQLRARGIDPNQMMQQVQQAMQQMQQGGGFDPQQFQQMMNAGRGGGGGGFNLSGANNGAQTGNGEATSSPEYYQAQLEFSDEEWPAVKPIVMAVVEKLPTPRLTLGMGFGQQGFTFGRGRGAATTAEPATAQTESEEAALRSAVDSGATTAEIKAKLAELRTANEKKAAELKKAREKLRPVLNVRREAKAVLLGLLE